MSPTESDGGVSPEPFLDAEFSRPLVEDGSDAIVAVDEHRYEGEGEPGGARSAFRGVEA
ncbi:MAG: hypothetical protein ABEJ43_11315 [Haloferacaceae archaeon]